MTATNPPPSPMPEASSMPPPAPPPPASPAYAPQWASPPPPPRRKTWMIVAVVAVVIVVVLAAVLLLTWPHSSSGGSATFRGASSQVSNYMNGQPGGPWRILAAGGVNTAASASQEVNETSNLIPPSAGCSMRWLVANHTTLTVPAISASVQSGQAGAWVFGVANLTTVEAVFDAGGSITPIIAVSCPGLAALASLSLSSNLIDSATAANAAWNDGGSTFASSHTSVSAFYALLPSLSLSLLSSNPSWSVGFTSCPLHAGANVSGAEFNATVDAVTGTVTATNTTAIADCGSATLPNFPGGGGFPGSTPLGTAFGFGSGLNETGLSGQTLAANGCAAGDTCFVFSVSAATSGLIAGDMDFALHDAQGAAVGFSAVSFADLQGAIIAQYTVVGGWSTTVPATCPSGQTCFANAPISSTLTIILDTGGTSASSSFAGDGLVAIGVGTYSGTVTTFLG